MVLRARCSNSAFSFAAEPLLQRQKAKPGKSDQTLNQKNQVFLDAFFATFFFLSQDNNSRKKDFKMKHI